MIEYYLRIVAAWALLRLASLVVKDVEQLMQVSMQHPARSLVIDGDAKESESAE